MIFCYIYIMKKYTDIKIARYDLRKLTEMYHYCKGMQSELKKNLKYDSNWKMVSLFDDRCQSFVYRLALNEMQSRMKELKKNIKQLDRESTQRDIERVKREFPNLFK